MTPKRLPVRHWLIVAACALGLPSLGWGLGSLVALLATDQRLSHLEERVSPTPLQKGQNRQASDQETKQTYQNASDSIPTIDEFSGWKLHEKASYCTENMQEKSQAQWTQQYLCGVKYTDDKSATGSDRIVLLTIALFAVACVQALIYWKQARIMGGQLVAAVDAANAANLSAQAASKIIDMDQPYLLIRKIGDPQFIQTDAEMWGDHFFNVYVEVEIANYGRSPAILHAVHATVIPIPFVPPQLNPELFNAQHISGIVGTERDDVIVASIKGMQAHGPVVESIKSGVGSYILFIYGILLYSNGAGSVIESCFAFEWRGGEGGRCVRSTHPQHNYRKVYEGDEAQARMAVAAPPPIEVPPYARS